MKNFFVILFLLGFYFLFKKFPEGNDIQSLSTLLVGILLLSSYLCASIFRKIRFPKLTGYMLLGIVIGPIGLNYLSDDIMIQMDFLGKLALAIIAITAGGEFDFQRFKIYKKSMVFILLSQIVTVFIGTVLILMLTAGIIPLLSDFSHNMIFGFALLFAGTAVSMSPATTIGIITETDAKGKNTDIILSIIILNSILLVLFFPVLLAWAKFYIIESGYNPLTVVKEITVQIFGSISIGIIMGILIIWYIKKVKIEITIFLFCVAITISELTQVFGIEILLTSIIAGIVVRNFSMQGKRLISEIETFSLPLYIIFFCLTGASLHLDVLTTSILLTSVLLISRTLMIYSGTYVGAVLVKEDKLVKNYSWMGYIAQAGIALGLGIIIEKNIPGQIGKTFLTILIATVVINEMIGPVLLKTFLVKTKEAKTD